ncbi:BrxA/BrxB family bacilliredoxin [Staphylococcus aureus]
MDMNFKLYMNGVVEQARNEIESAGYEQLTTAEDVDKVLKQDRYNTSYDQFCMWLCRWYRKPAASHALHYDVLPDRLVTVFAGQGRKKRHKERVNTSKVMRLQVRHLH